MIKRKIKRNRQPRIKKRTRFLIDKKLLKKYGIDKLLNVKNSQLRDIRFYLNNTNKRRRVQKRRVMKRQNNSIPNRDELEREANLRAQIYRLERQNEQPKRETNVEENKTEEEKVDQKEIVKDEEDDEDPREDPRESKKRKEILKNIFKQNDIDSNYFKSDLKIMKVTLDNIYNAIVKDRLFYDRIYNMRKDEKKLKEFLMKMRKSIDDGANQDKRDKKGKGYSKYERQAFQRNEGMTNHQINKLMKKYKVPNYVGCIMSDELHLLPKNKKKMCFIYNTDNSSGPGIHWCGIIITNRTLEYFDPLANHIRRGFLKDIKKILKRNDIPPLLLKTNAIRDQRASSSNCGWFSCKFLVDRLIKNKPFSEATGYKSIQKAEKAIGIFRKKFSKII